MYRYSPAQGDRPRHTLRGHLTVAPSEARGEGQMNKGMCISGPSPFAGEYISNTMGWEVICLITKKEFYNCLMEFLTM